jgi:hypothetical protein
VWGLRCRKVRISSSTETKGNNKTAMLKLFVVVLQPIHLKFQCSDECLTYALENRKEWARKGREIVKEMVQRFRMSKEYKLNLALKCSIPTKPKQEKLNDDEQSAIISPGKSEPPQSRDVHDECEYSDDGDDDGSVVYA